MTKIIITNAANRIVNHEPIEWVEAMDAISFINTIENLRELRNEVVQRYSELRTDYSLSEVVMDNLMLVTTVIDTKIYGLGGEV